MCGAMQLHVCRQETIGSEITRQNNKVKGHKTAKVKGHQTANVKGHQTAKDSIKITM